MVLKGSSVQCLRLGVEWVGNLGGCWRVSGLTVLIMHIYDMSLSSSVCSKDLSALRVGTRAHSYGVLDAAVNSGHRDMFCSS